ncbi:macrophage migration inhibitory factor-like [Tubulanus polymorphus]|uniref:macrophage migration inhibitory factor-like n=1 Tax=Tubulanus polymorphus TaxID=672921 RepID=UPI003DA6C392
MPTLRIDTNVANDAVPDGFLVTLTDLVARLVGKDKRYVCIHLNSGQRMTFGGSTDPCAVMSLESIGKISADENRRYCPELTEAVHNALGISPTRIYVNFHDRPRHEVGNNGGLFG